MPPSSRRCFINTSFAAALISILYRYWLVTPVLKSLSIGQWRLVAVVVAAASGCLLFRLKLPMLALACASMAGLLIGGTWAAWQAPSDVTIGVRVTSGVLLAGGDGADRHCDRRWVLLRSICNSSLSLMIGPSRVALWRLNNHAPYSTSTITTLNQP